MQLVALVYKDQQVQSLARLLNFWRDGTCKDGKGNEETANLKLEDEKSAKSM